jgi:hypothetical protein
MSIPNLSGNFAVSLWFKANNFNPVGEQFFTNPNNGMGGFGMGTFNNGTEFGLASPNVFGISLFSYSFSTGTWYHIVISRNNGNFSAWVNGVNQNVNYQSTYDFSGPLALGWDNFSSFAFDGTLDEVGIWTKALNDTDVSTLYNGGIGLQYPFSAAENLTNGIKAYWKLDNDGSGNVSLSDSTINNYTLTNNGNVSLGTGIIQGDASFNGSNWLSSDFSRNLLTSPTSISFWFKTSDVTSTQTLVGWVFGLNIWLESGLLKADNYSFASAIQTTINENTWHHVVLITNGSTAYLYLDGNFTVSDTNTFGDISGLTIGGGIYGSLINAFNGEIDEVGIWDRVLSQEEITLLYNNDEALSYPFIPTNGLSLWLDANDSATVLNSGTPATNGDPVSQWSDKSGNNNHATQSNGSLQPILSTNTLNGKPTIYFDGSGQQLNFVNNIAGDVYSIFIVCKNTDNSVGSMFFWNNQNNFASYFGVIKDPNWNPVGKNRLLLSNYDANGGYGNSDFAYSGLLANNDFFLGSAVRNNSNIKVCLDGIKGDTFGSFTRTDTFNKIGGYGFGYEINGNIAEIIAYNRALSDLEKRDVETYLNSKYNLYAVPNIVQDGLVLWLDAADSRSYPGTGNTWYDLSPSNNNGNLNYGVTFNSGVMQFDGSSGYVNFGSYTPENESFTLEIVFNWGRFDTANVDFLFSGNFEQFELHTGGDTGVNGLRFIPSGGARLDETSIISSTTNHITYIWDHTSGTAYLYKNGQFITSAVLQPTTDIRTLQVLENRKKIYK